MIRERIPWQPKRDGLAWNVMPGGLVTLPRFADSWTRYPFYAERLGGYVGATAASATPAAAGRGDGRAIGPQHGVGVGWPPEQADGERFTAVVYAGQVAPTARIPGGPPAPPPLAAPAPALVKLLRNVGHSASIGRVGTLQITAKPRTSSEWAHQLLQETRTPLESGGYTQTAACDACTQ